MKFGLVRKNDKISTDLDFFRNQVTSLFDDFFKIEPVGLWENDWVPALDVEEDAAGITVRAELPGLTEKNIEISLERNLLTISGEKKEEKKTSTDDNRRIVTERSFGSFKRTIMLPAGITGESVKAEYKNGVLTIRVPRSKIEETKKIKIDIN